MKNVLCWQQWSYVDFGLFLLLLEESAASTGCSLFLVTLKKSSIRVCLLRPAALSLSRSSRLLSRVWRNLSIRRRTLSTFTYLTWQRNPTKASSSGSVQMSLGSTVCGASKNILRASLYFQKCGTGWVCLLICKTTFSIVRCFWIRVRAFFGPKPVILSQ